jgi:Asp-tRNA(Asn)/Glu-tRNA(Gln) amidotransferase A subunit family amidase
MTRILRSAGLAVTVGAVVSACGPSPQPIPLVEATIPDVQAAILDGRTTCRMVVQGYLDRIAAYDGPINAITEVNPRALQVADSVDAALAAGDEPGALFCVPVLVKDNFDTHDMVTTGGSIALINSLPPDDAFMVRRIREEGAIVLAKTNLAEWAFTARQSVSSAYDTTRNAYALDRVPAGSSGGTASGVAANLGLVGLGSDTGNSIRGPSSHLSLVGIRSTIGLTSRDGVIPLSFDRDIAGPMGRTVADVVRVFDVVAGYDPGDPYTELGRGRREPDYTAFLNAEGLQGARIGVLVPLVDVEDPNEEIRAIFDQAVADLRRLGAEVMEVDMDLDAELDRSNLFCRRFRYDIWTYTGTLENPPFRDVATLLETGQIHEHAERTLRNYSQLPLDVHPAQWDPPCPDYPDHEGRQAFLAAVAAVMDSVRVDALIYPSWTHPPAHIDRANEEYRGDNSQLVAPPTGMPAITVPMGYSYGNLPVGLQILGRPYSEGRLFELAYAYEQGTLHRRPPEGFGELASEGGED